MQPNHQWEKLLSIFLTLLLSDIGLNRDHSKQLQCALQCSAMLTATPTAMLKSGTSFCSIAVILLRSSSATVDIIPKRLVFSYVMRSSEVQPKLQRTLMTSFQKFAPEQWFCSGAVLQQLTSFQTLRCTALLRSTNCNALCCLEWTLIYDVFTDLTICNLSFQEGEWGSEGFISTSQNTIYI